MGFNLDNIIYFYIGICIILLIYDIFFIFYSNRQKKKYLEYSDIYYKLIKEQLDILERENSIKKNHKKDLEKELININKLTAYSLALDTLRDEGEDLESYLSELYLLIEDLSYKYKRREVYDKAFFAFFISKNPPCDGKVYNNLMETLISYLDNSNVYCRENVLKALYALGNSQAVENAFQIINKKGLFHHNKLLSDGLISFKGDKEELAENLWHYFDIWEQNIIISIIEFITRSSDKFKERFLVILSSKDTNVEIKIGLIRYFRSHIYKPVKPILINFLNERDLMDRNIIIVSASALSKYPGEDTMEALIKALKDRNWNVRYNAALSLRNLGADINELEEVLLGHDIYAKEMLDYTMGLYKEVDEI